MRLVGLRTHYKFIDVEIFRMTFIILQGPLNSLCLKIAFWYPRRIRDFFRVSVEAPNSSVITLSIVSIFGQFAVSGHLNHVTLEENVSFWYGIACGFITGFEFESNKILQRIQLAFQVLKPQIIKLKLLLWRRDKARKFCEV